MLKMTLMNTPASNITPKPRLLMMTSSCQGSNDENANAIIIRARATKRKTLRMRRRIASPNVPLAIIQIVLIT